MLLKIFVSTRLLAPARSDGGTRLYSENDLQRLRSIGELLEAGLNLTGIEMVFELQEANEGLRRHIESLESARKK
jgi:MerR family transcriptional regulator/heat shock protein HspR